MEENTERTLEENSGSKIGRLLVFLVIIFGIVALVVWNLTYTPPVSSEVWDEGMVIGDLETATRHYVQYSDFACPYCDIFSRAIIENEEAFEQYLAANHIAYEVRLTDMIYDSTRGMSEMSRTSAIAGYCAKREGKFIEYYHEGVMALYRDYHSKGIGDSKTSPAITDMPDDYWLTVGHNIGLGESFDECNKNQETLDEVLANTTKAAKATSGGLPYFAFEEFTMAGLAYTDWNWEHTLEYLNAGLEK